MLVFLPVTAQGFAGLGEVQSVVGGVPGSLAC